MCDFIAAVNMVPDSRCWVRVNCKRVFCQGHREDEPDGTVHNKSYLPLLGTGICVWTWKLLSSLYNCWWWPKQDLRCGELKEAVGTQNGCEACKYSLDRGHISCLPPAAIHLQVRETGEKRQRKNTGARVSKRRWVFPEHHSFSCYRDVVERFIDYLRTHSVRVDKAAVRCNRGRGVRSKQANMNDREWGDPFL